MTERPSAKPTGEMMSDILGNVGNLVRSEVDLARTEITSSLLKAAGALGGKVMAGLLAITGLNVLAARLVAMAVWAGVPTPWAAVAVGHQRGLP